jgi:hypothetical protein
MPQFVNQISGRFGNSIFRYLASVVMCIVYDGQLAYEPQNATHIVTDDFFLRWMTRLLDDNVAEDIDGDFFEKGTSRAVFNATHTARQMKIQENAYKHLLNYIAAGGEPKVNNLYIYKNAEGSAVMREIHAGVAQIPETEPAIRDACETKTDGGAAAPRPKCFFMCGYFQFDRIYAEFRDRIFRWIQANPSDLVVSDDLFFSLSKPLIHTPPALLQAYRHKDDYTAVHIRLKDFLSVGWVVHPYSLQTLLDDIRTPLFVFVVEKPVYEVEKRYLLFFRARYANSEFRFGNIEDDYHTMRNAKKIVCGYSTFAWASSFFSTSADTVYMPRNAVRGDHSAVFRAPINHTVFYRNKVCFLKEMEDFFKVRTERAESAVQAALRNIRSDLAPRNGDIQSRQSRSSSAISSIINTMSAFRAASTKAARPAAATKRTLLWR